MIEIHNQDNIAENNIIEKRNSDEKNEDEYKLFQMITDQSLFNAKRTKIISKDNYNSLIKIINGTKLKEFIYFLNYLNKVGIPILKVLVNGFIEFDNDKNQDEIILEIIAKCINLYFNKNIFYFVYKKLSKFFRRHDKLKDIKSIQRFEKLFTIWKILYNLENLSPICPHNNTPSITFFSNLNQKNKNLKIEIKRFKKGENYFSITICFLQSPILNINKYINNFSFLKVYDENKNKYKFRYKDVFNDKSGYKFKNLSQVDKIKIEFKSTIFSIYINDKQIITNSTNFNFDLISKMTILNYFFGDISSIIIKNKNDIIEKNQRLLLKINLEKYISNDKINFDVNFKDENEVDQLIEDNLVQYKGEIFDNQIIHTQNFNIWKGRKNDFDLSDIEYFGGFDSFIPLFKIVKYNIISFQNLEISQNEKEDYINNSLKWIKDILRIIIKLISLSENNYNNFTNIIIPLIGSLSEIIHSLNNLYSSKIISNKYKNILFKDQIIYDFYIILANANIQTNIISTYQKIFEIDINFDNINKTIDYPIIINIDKIKLSNKSLFWHFKIIYSFVTFILLYTDSKDKIPIELISQLNSINIYINNNFKNENEENIVKSFTPFVSLVNIYLSGEFGELNNKFISFFYLINESLLYFRNIILSIKIILNSKDLLELNGIKRENNLISKQIDLFPKFDFQINKKKEVIIKRMEEVANNFKYYKKHKALLVKIFPFLTNQGFLNDEENLLNELINYHQQYHSLIKELFIFNRLWSDQKLFFDCTFKKRIKSNLKYKNVNYYTTNFQRPIIYPVLDYKYKYPIFTSFKFEKSLYKEKESEDDYNFDFDSPELDKFVDEYNEKIFKEIGNNINIKIFKVCRIKQQYHVKGNLFIVKNDNKKLILFFHANPYDFENKTENKLSCHKFNENNLCFGSTFKCHNKEKNRIIKINMKNIRLFIKRIYYYRKSAIEIFNFRKSYYFNFFSEEEFNNFFDYFSHYFEAPYFPININKTIFGYIKLNNSEIESHKLTESIKNHNFIKFISDKSSYGELCEMSNFDLILLINLISNRSYIDLNQYPIFPMLFFYDKNMQIIKRDFKEHIGFQNKTDSQKQRKELIIESYKSNKGDEDIEERGLSYFNTHYSNIVYTSNFMIRLFPYSFLCIELQGNGFDNPNRLFFSIEDTFYNISIHKSDLRELIPEFFYLPEMFMNINSFDFGKKIDKQPIDNVIMPLLVENGKEINRPDKIDEKNENEDILKCFLFIESIKNKLEKVKNDKLNSWFDLIFGDHQRYKTKQKDKNQYFRNQGYIDINKDTYQKYLNNNAILGSVEFGLIPLQTIQDNKYFTNRKINYDISKIKNVNRRKNSVENNNIIVYKSYKMSNSKYWEEYLDIGFRIDKNNNFGKIEVTLRNSVINKINDHNDKIIDIFCNQRLNMFATTSLDGFALIYIIPNKLFSAIKHPNKLYFTNVFLISNPFPAIITFDNNNNENIFRSYSLSGLLIKEQKIGLSKIKINPILNTYGGTFKDRIEISDESNKFIKLYDLPFFNEVNYA